MGKKQKPPRVRSRFEGRTALRWAAVILIPSFAASYLLADWWVGLPADVQATYIGRNTCAECHAGQMKLWENSHHDLAMDIATPETVRADFEDAELEHDGIVSRMYRDGEAFMVHTEGPDGTMRDFRVKYVFGVEPLQQYMVELDRPAGMPSDQISRLQVLRLSWDTEKREWFYLSPPDVDEKLGTDDPLHWTGSAQNWNHMCADCHSTNVRKNYDLKTRTYHTTFSEIDVSCEACHGPGSLHVSLARSNSPFWDRKLGYGLKTLKGADSKNEIETCAPCHSRRHVVHEGDDLHDGYYDCFQNGLLRPETYYADGQILDEVYVYGSYIQSKMYHKGIRCTDCHDPHTTRVKAQDNTLCVSCHTHTPAKYDTSGHHFHSAGSKGSLCVECHMPETPYMDVDLRRDHSLRVPRPDLSVELNTPNACTGCHLDRNRVAAEKRAKLQHYSQWLTAARAGDQEVAAELDRVNRWAADRFKKWYGDKQRPHFAHGLAASWNNEQDAAGELMRIATSRQYPAIARASALVELQRHGTTEAIPVAQDSLRDKDPQIRLAAVTLLENQRQRELLKTIPPLLNDPVRAVRVEAARVLAIVPLTSIPSESRDAFRSALTEYQDGLRVNSDQAGAHMALAVLAERMRRPQDAMRAYQAAIHVQPDVTGPRSNLAALLDRSGQVEAANKLRVEELKLLARDARLAPEHAWVRYRYGLALYLNGQFDQALSELEKACELDADESQFRLALTLLYERLGRWDDALQSLRMLGTISPSQPSLRELEMRIRSGREADKQP